MANPVRTLHPMRWCLALLVAGSLATAAQAAPSGDTARAAKAKSRTVKSAKYDRGWGETVSERERRLYRECQGRPNAGACEGYAR